MEAMQTHGCATCRDAGGRSPVLSMRDVIHHELMQKTEELHHMQAYIHGT